MKVCQTAVQMPGCEKATRQLSSDHSVGWPILAMLKLLMKTKSTGYRM